MGKGFKVELVGMDKLIKKIERMGKEEELKTQIRIFADEARRDLQHQTFVSFVKGYSKGTTRDKSSSKIEPSGKSVIVGTETDYAPFVEFGTRFMEPEPFVQPMAERQSRNFRRRLERLVK